MVGGETTKDRYYLGLITLGWESLPCLSLQRERIDRQRDGIEWATLHSVAVSRGKESPTSFASFPLISGKGSPFG